MKRPALRALAERLGLLGEYIDQRGRTVRASDASREALLSVMGFDAPTEDAAHGWLSELDAEQRETMVAPVRVVERDDRSATRVRVQLPPGMPTARLRLVVTEETGQAWKTEATVRRGASVGIPSALPYGYHRVQVTLSAAGREVEADQALIVVPTQCVTPAAGRKEMGIVANLYSVRREHDWGIGDLGTLSALVDWAGSRGAAFVGVNPLHSLFNRGADVSPYSPVSRLHRNHIYIDVEAVPELAHSEEARQLLNRTATRATLRALRDARHVDYDAAIDLKERVLAALHRTFRDRGGQRARDYQEFVRTREPELTHFATWMALATESRMPDWQQWPSPLRSPASDAVAAVRSAQEERVDFFRWLQFETFRQLGAVASRARERGMSIGVYQDLAIGTNPGGSDTWTFPELFLAGASVGAPPDPLGPKGQNWGLPPMDPRALRQQRYRYWIQLLRRAFEHAGALRIDHVMGLFRTFWIPAGGTGKDGAYVRYDHREMLGILALESVRHGALVVGEDLGTVPAEVAPALRKWGLLSSKVLYFERTGVEFTPAARYPALSLATANTHDLASLAGFWTGRDLEIRKELGLLRTPAELRRARRARAADKAALLRRLRLEPPGHYAEAQFPRKLAGAAHEFLCSTPAALVGASLDDLTGETEPVNVPGVGQDRFPSWRRRSSMTMEQIAWSFSVDDAMRCEKRRTK